MDKEKKAKAERQHQTQHMLGTSSFSGGLKAKTKTELQDIALALGISEDGMKADILECIKMQLDTQPHLLTNPRFSGLFSVHMQGRKRPTNEVTSTTSYNELNDDGGCLPQQCRLESGSPLLCAQLPKADHKMFGALLFSSAPLYPSIPSSFGKSYSYGHTNFVAASSSTSFSLQNIDPRLLAPSPPSNPSFSPS